MGDYISNIDPQPSQSGKDASRTGGSGSREPNGSGRKEQIGKVIRTFAEQVGKVAPSLFGGQQSQPARRLPARRSPRQSGFQLGETEAVILGLLATGGIAYAVMERSGSKSESSSSE